MAYFTYILRSINTSRYYIGSTNNTNKRVIEHNSGKVRSTKNRGPYQLVHAEPFPTRQEAYRREQQIKKYKGGEGLKNLLHSH